MPEFSTVVKAILTICCLVYGTCVATASTAVSVCSTNSSNNVSAVIGCFILTSFEEFVEQIETAVYAVATQVPYTRHQILSISFTTVENAGIYYYGVKEWRRKDMAEKTW